MSLTLEEAYKKLLNSKEFKNEGFLCNCFLAADKEDLEKADWQIDFYNKETDRITSYWIEEKIQVKEDLEVFKEPTTTITELKIEEVKVNVHEAIKIAESLLGAEKPNKIMALLQNQEGIIWNVSIFTNYFNLHNIKINNSKELIENKKVNLMSFDK
jgi:hypothetical protein